MGGRRTVASPAAATPSRFWCGPTGTGRQPIKRMLLGIVPDPFREDRAVSLSPGDALVFYTDGVIESRGADGSLDEDRLAELLSTCAGRGADAIAATVEDAALRSNLGQRRDDIAVLVLRVAA